MYWVTSLDLKGIILFLWRSLATEKYKIEDNNVDMRQSFIDEILQNSRR